MRTIHAARCAAIAFAVAVGAAQAAGQPAPPPADRQVDDARHYLELANDAFARKDHERALEYYRHAHRLAPNPMLHYNMGNALAGMSRHAEAIEELEAFLRDASAAPANLRARARAEIERLETLVGLIVIDVNVDGAAVEINRRPVGITPLGKPLRIDAGAHQIRVSKPGHAAFEKRVGITRGRTVRLTAALVEIQPSRPGARKPRSFWQRHRGSTIFAGAGLALGGAGLIFGGLTWRDYRDLAGTCAGTAAGCPAAEIDAVERKALTTNILLGAAGAAAITSAVLFLFAEDGPDRGRERPRPATLTPAPGGAALLVRF